MSRLAPFAVLGALAAGCAAPTLQQTQLTQSAYDAEDYNFGLAPTSAIRRQPYEGPTPLVIDDAKTIKTPELRAIIVSPQPPILVDVLGGNPTESLPGAIWARRAGFSDVGAQAALSVDLEKLTSGDKATPVVFFCLSKICWLSHNAAVRAVALGYINVYWYRGGRNAWIAAGLPMTSYTAVLQ
jgi:PQQ-dependent catabolism-associated CXXCW motif protein